MKVIKRESQEIEGRLNKQLDKMGGKKRIYAVVRDGSLHRVNNSVSLYPSPVICFHTGPQFQPPSSLHSVFF